MSEHAAMFLLTALQCVYLALFWYLLEKKGFHLAWFVPLAAVFVAATFVAAWRFTGDWFPQSPDARRVFGPGIFTALSLVVVYPLHAGITLGISRLFEVDDMHFFKRILWRAIIFAIAIPITGCILMTLMIALGLLGGLAYSLYQGLF